MEYARGLGVTLAEHCEDKSLAGSGAMHEGAWSSRLGVPAAPAEAEFLMAARDIALSRLTGARLHLLHVSCASTLKIAANAKAEGLAVTVEVTPHHMSLTDATLAGFDPVFKVNPPLRTACDVAAVRAACASGDVDAIATDHAPHPPESKDLPLAEAPPGMIGLETALAVSLGALVRGSPEVSANGRRRALESSDVLELRDVIALMSWKPARIAGISVEQGGDQGGPIAVGLPANLCVIDPGHKWTVEAGTLSSKSRNTPFDARMLEGKARHTVYRGEPVVIDFEAQR
jgi:dihydroorotase